MSTRGFRIATLFFAACLLLPSLAYSQSVGGSLSGRVKDQANLGVGGAPVRIVNTATGQTRSVSTNNEGRYEARELPPGLYEVTIEQSGFKTVTLKDVRVGVGGEARLQTITLEPIPVEERVVVTADAEISMVQATSPTLSTSFSEKQIRELPVLTRDINNLALLAPGVFSVRAFSFASTLVPFAANGSRGRDNNFIIDSVDNNEPLFGGAATQFTNSDLFAEYRILTNQFKAEYGRNSGSVVNIITERGGNVWHGSAFWYGQSDIFNATNSVERVASLAGPTRFYENQTGFTFGGPIKKESTWVFGSYQWDRARNDLSPVFPLVATLPTPAGLSALNAITPPRATLNALLAVPSVIRVPGLTSPCGAPGSGLPLTNPCTVGSVNVGATAVPFGTFLVPRGGVFDIRDHQGSLRLDHRVSQRDDIYMRYLFDDLLTPRTTGALPAEVAFSDFGLLPEWRVFFLQRTQNLGMFWTHAWPTALHELRGSFTRISSQTGPFEVSRQARELLPAVTVVDFLAFNTAPGGTAAGTASLLAAFPASGQVFTLGRDSRPTRVNTNIYQVQDNVSISTGRHSIKFGANFVRTQSNIRQTPSDLGQYIYFSLSDFVNNLPGFAFRRFADWRGTRQGKDVLPVREFAQFYFWQDDFRVRPNITLSIGMRYEYYGQALNTLARMNSLFGSPIKADRNNFAPRFGFAYSPDSRTVVRGGYGLYYNPTVFNIALLAWQSGPISPFVAGFPGNVYPNPPFSTSILTQTFTNCNFTTPTGPASAVTCTQQDKITPRLVQPYVQNFSLAVQRQYGKDWLFEVAWVGSKGTKLFQRLDRNANQGWTITPTATGTTSTGAPCTLTTCANVFGRPRLNTAKGPVFEITNAARSTYYALQFTATKRLNKRYGTAVTAAYTWSHMIDNASEIFGPGIRQFGSLLIGAGGLSGGSLTAIEAITPFPQDPNNGLQGERGNSSFDRRHRVSASYLWALPTPESGLPKHFLGNWQFNGFVTYQSGAPFTPINAFLSCVDAFGDGNRTNDRPDVGNPNAPKNTVAILNNTLCLDPRDTGTLAFARANPRVVGAGDYITPDGLAANPANVYLVQVGRNHRGNAGRNILIGPQYFNVDVALFKNIPWGERRNIQLRVESYNVLNTRNPGNPIGNVFTTDAQPVPAIAFSPSLSPARVIGTIPENAIDARDPITGEAQFLSRRFMNTSARKFQFAVKFLF